MKVIKPHNWLINVKVIFVNKRFNCDHRFKSGKVATLSDSLTVIGSILESTEYQHSYNPIEYKITVERINA